MSAVIAESFGAIYERNAINSALPILIAPGLVNMVRDKDVITVDFMTGEIINKTQGKNYQARPFSDVQAAIFARGGLLQPVL
jgi:3-isopropylmalate dehydratase small subunit